MFSFVFFVLNSQIASCACHIEYEIAEKEKREEIKGKKKGKSIEKDDYVEGEPQRIVI